MAVGKFTLQSFIDWFEPGTGDGLFASFQLPAGIDKEIAISTIFMRCNEFPLLYIDPVFLRDAIGSWSVRKRSTFERWNLALSETYNPTHNYDRYEDWEDDTSGTGKALDKVSAFDSDTLRNNVQSETEGKSNSKRKGHAYGNIGVMTAMETVRQEIALREEFNIYDLIASEFAKEFCVPVY